MHRNGKSPRIADMTLQGSDATSQGSDTASQGSDTASQGFMVAPQPAAISAQRQIRAFSLQAGVAQRLLAAHMALDAALNNQLILDTLAAHGYTASRLMQGQALIVEAQTRYEEQRKLKGEQLAATDARNAARATAHGVYMRHVEIARVALRNDRGTAEMLDLSATRRRELASWLLQTRQFYANTLNNPDVVSALECYGVTRQLLEGGRALVNAVLASHVTQQQRKSAAEAATRARKAAFAALDRWMRDFKAIARVALAGQPE